MKHKLNLFFATIVVVILLLTAATAQTDEKNKDRKQSVPTTSAEAQPDKKSVEKRLIEMAYNKMSILDSSERIYKAKKNKQKPDFDINNPKLKFKLSDFVIGDISEISNRLYRELVTPPTGEILQVATIETKENDGESRISVKAEWRPGYYSSGVDPQWTIADVFALEAVRFADVGRYASYQVKITFEGKTRIYQALALFHNRGATDGNLNPEILDSVSGYGGTLTKILKDKRLPVGTKQQNKQQKLAEIEMKKVRFEDNNKKTGVVSPEFTINGGYNCAEWDYNPFYYWGLYGDPFMIECLVWELPIDPGDVIGGGQESCPTISTPISHPQIFESSNAHHASGSHMARSQFTSTCQQDSNCTTSCNVIVETGNYAETGVTTEYLYYHVGASTVHRKNATGIRDTLVQCEAGMGYAFKRCLFDCGVTATVSVTGSGNGASISVSGGDLWNVGHIQGRNCQNGN